MAKRKAASTPKPMPAWRKIIAADAEDLHPINLDILAAALEAGDIDGAIVKAYEIGVQVGPQRFRKLLESEFKRRYKQVIDANSEKADKQNRVNLAHAIYDAIPASDKKRRGNKGGKMEAYKLTGKLMAQSLGLVDKDGKIKPITGDTVRKEYLSKKKTGEG